MLKQRVITAVALLAILLPALFAPVAWPFAVLTLLLIGAAGWEWARLNGPSGAAAVACGVAPEALDEDTLGRYMALAHAPDPDLFIRTGGEVRISNFLLWQVAYSELVFSDCLWPDFDETELDRAFRVYAQRDRRFGGVKPEAATMAGSPDAA